MTSDQLTSIAGTTTYWQLEKEYYTLVADYDIIVRVIEHESIKRTEGEGVNSHEVVASLPKKVHEYKCKRNVLISSSPYFAKLLRETAFEESRQDIVELREQDTVVGVTVWLAVVHHADTDANGIDNYVSNVVRRNGHMATDLTFDKGKDVSIIGGVDLRGVWETLAAAHKYGFDCESRTIKAWFGQWYMANETDHSGKRFDYKAFQQLLFPCYAFDYSPGFQCATRYVVHRATGHITERRPKGFMHHDFSLDTNIIQQLNAAKSRLKTILHRSLYAPIHNLLKLSHCQCNGNVLFSYEQSLSKTGAWPLERSFASHSVSDILRQLENFRALQTQNCGSKYCAFDQAAIVDASKTETRRYFDGLCLDCMKHSKVDDSNEEYWSHSKSQVNWDRGCRIRHHQPTWYFSFLGHRQNMREWTQSLRGDRQGHGRGNQNRAVEEVAEDM